MRNNWHKLLTTEVEWDSHLREYYSAKCTAEETDKTKHWVKFAELGGELPDRVIRRVRQTSTEQSDGEASD